MPPKKRTKNVGTSSSRATGPRYQPQFPKDEQMITYLDLLKKEVGTFHYPDEPTLTAAGLHDEVMTLLRRGWWQHLFFGIRETTYKEVTCEVLATIKVPRSIRFSDNHRPLIKFRAFNEDHAISIYNIQWHLGFTRIEDRAEDEAGLTDFPRDVDRQKFWESISRDGGTYDPRDTPRVIHSLLSSTITGRAEVAGKVSTTDLLCLYCMIHNKLPHMGAIIAGLFHRQSTYKIKAIFSGPYITSLLRGMGYGDHFVNMDESSYYAPLTKLPELNTGVARRRRLAEQPVEGEQRVPHQAGIHIQEGGAAGHVDDDDEEEHHTEGGGAAMDHDAAHSIPVMPPAFQDAFSSWHEEQRAYHVEWRESQQRHHRSLFESQQRFFADVQAERQRQQELYRQMRADQQAFFQEVRAERQTYHRELQRTIHEDITTGFSNLRVQYAELDTRVTSLESSWNSFFDAQQPPPPPEQ
ncbi:unnamed protein product [Cuscuta epithymum]|uniref:Uncharacterized protein n=1 Tax=Cuscuta epithymum TaxID=186058 RepID=A0AAV0C7K3_9ASTE|nr:unnamed protein product [Cuscuta epithymum]